MADLKISVDRFDVMWAIKHSVAIGPGIMLPEHFTARANVDGHEIEVVIASDPFGARAARVCVSEGDPRGVTSELIRRVPVGKIVREAARRVVWITDEEGVAVFGFHNDRLLPPLIAQQWPDGDTDVFLTHASAVYRVAEALGEPPTAAVATAAGVSRATAGRIVDAARKRRMLRPAVKPRSAGWKTFEDLQEGRPARPGPPPPGDTDVINVISLPGYAESAQWDFDEGSRPVILPAQQDDAREGGAPDGEHPEA